MIRLTLTTKEQSGLQVLNGVLTRVWPVWTAAVVLGVSERHAWRLLAAYRKEGAAALAHGDRDAHRQMLLPCGSASGS